jgi:hypothetical protein
MKAFSASILAVLVAAMPLSASSADTDKTLQNVKGNVSYGASATAPDHKLAPKAQAAINDADYAVTGPDSLATISLPDSSQISMASNSSVQMTSFNQSDIAHAKFLVVGKIRFNVNHPNGAKADYTFTTTTGQIAVRGTIGDIFSGPQGLQVNVYAASQPVQVTLVNGQVFSLAAGQSLVATTAAGAITATTTAVSQSVMSPFSELGNTAGVSSSGTVSAAGATGASGAGGAGAAAGGAASGAAAGTTAAIAGGAVAAGAAAATIANSSSTTAPAPTATPTIAPSPSPSTTSVPITVGHPSPQPIRGIPGGGRGTPPPSV